MKLRELLITDIAQRDFDIREIHNFMRGPITMSWGMNSVTKYKDSVLAFKVQGYIHKGWVYVSLDFDDTFTITLTKANRTTIKKQIKGVYIDQLVNVLDINIEKQGTDEEYKNQIETTYNLK